MDASPQDLTLIAAVGIGATLVMDLWLALSKRLGMPGSNMAFIGRWLAHLPRGRWRHDAIARAAPVPGETMLGWLFHYGVGIAFAALLAAVAGTGWLHAPSAVPALALGIATTAAPLFVMQPAMGAGVASSRTQAPLKNTLRTFANHAVFGAGLYLSALLVQSFAY